MGNINWVNMQTGNSNLQTGDSNLQTGDSNLQTGNSTLDMTLSLYFGLMH